MSIPLKISAQLMNTILLELLNKTAEAKSSSLFSLLFLSISFSKPFSLLPQRSDGSF